MKLFTKIAVILLAAATLVALKPAAKAADGKIVTAAMQKAGDLLTVTVAMDEAEVTSLGISVSLDSGLQLRSTSWIPEGLMANFDTSRNKGVFSAGSNAARIGGDIFLMELTADDPDGYHEIVITVIGKKGANTVFDETVTISFGEMKFIYGDANGDGNVTDDDATAIKRYRAGLIAEAELDLSVCDLDGNGNVDVYDACLIQYYVRGMIEIFPVQNSSSTSN